MSSVVLVVIVVVVAAAGGLASFVALRNKNTEENKRQDHAQRANNDVRNCQEEVLSTEQVGRREHELFSAGEGRDIVVIFDSKIIGVGGQAVLNHAVQLAERGQARSPHPHDEML